MARCASSTNREDWARCLRNNVVDRSDVQMRCKPFCRPGSHHDQIRMPPFRNVQDLLCRWSLLDDVGRVAPQSGLLRNQRSEEHTSELQSQSNLVCRLLLE